MKLPYSITLEKQTDRIIIKFRLLSGPLNTAELPLTYNTVTKYLPNIVKAKCFNRGNLPFSEEIKKTEVGHLFEHIFIEYLCLDKLDSGAPSACYRGSTKWNWEKEPRGTFNVTISLLNDPSPWSEKSLTKSLSLLNLLLTSTSAV